MKKHLLLTTVVILLAALFLRMPAQAITFGELDGDRHPNVGAIVFEDNGEKVAFCSGTLISPTVFLTAAHCVNFLPLIGIPADDVWVTFDPVFDPQGTFYPATYYTNPDAWINHAHPNDIAVLVLDEPITDITPAELPPAGLLDQMKANGTLKNQHFIAVGYGVARDDKTGGWHHLYSDDARRFVEQSFHSLTKPWLTLSMNPSTGDGGTCYGDSGGPHFLGDSNMTVALTVTGDRYCRATDVDFRLDTKPARDYLSKFVELP